MLCQYHKAITAVQHVMLSVQLRAGAVLRRWTLDPQYERQLVTAEDGGTIGLDHYRGAHTAGSLPVGAPILLVLHGVTGACSCHVPTSRPCRFP